MNTRRGFLRSLLALPALALGVSACTGKHEDKEKKPKKKDELVSYALWANYTATCTNASGTTMYASCTAADEVEFTFPDPHITIHIEPKA